MTGHAQQGYRPDIDGLRALAVLSVVGYHAFPTSLTGGFVGVDVFFVISGYLISTIIFRGVERGTFSYRDFYVRRAKRIFPALAVVLGASLAFGWVAALPDELRSLGKHAAAGAGFVSNLVLWKESGYFDTASELKPLLHLWSLGIEEQYYICWPLLVAASFSRSRRILPLMLFLLVSSFLLNVSLVSGHPVAAFYSPATRFWEILLGAVLAHLCIHHGGPIALIEHHLAARQRGCGLVSNVLAWVGLALITASISLTTSRSTFPGWWALLPTSGAFLVIGAGPFAWPNRVLLSHRLVVFFGLISYPLYLWHWPLLTFPRVIYGSVSPLMRAMAVATSVALAWLTYQFVESPIRLGRATPRRPVVLCGLVALIGAFGGYLFVSKGRPDRFDTAYLDRLSDVARGASSLQYSPCDPALEALRPGIEFCAVSSAQPPVAAVFGDSHAESIFSGIASADREHGWLLAGHSACPPVSGISVEGGTTHCQDRSENILRYLVAHAEIRTVVLAFFGNYFKDTDVAADHLVNHFGPSTITISGGETGTHSRLDMFRYGLERTVTDLESSGKEVVLMVDVPELPFFPKDCIPRLFKSTPASGCVIPESVAMERQAELRGLIDDIRGRHPRLRVFDPIEFLCEGDVCRIEADGVLIYRDSHHLSPRGSERVARHLVTWLYGRSD